jgi:hypothetical protein
MSNTNLNDELNSEYDLSNLRVRKVGAERAAKMARGVVLDSDVAEEFPDSAAVNEALRFLIRVTKQGRTELTPKS